MGFIWGFVYGHAWLIGKALLVLVAVSLVFRLWKWIKAMFDHVRQVFTVTDNGREQFHRRNLLLNTFPHIVEYFANGGPCPSCIDTGYGRGINAVYNEMGHILFNETYFKDRAFTLWHSDIAQKTVKEGYDLTFNLSAMPFEVRMMFLPQLIGMNTRGWPQQYAVDCQRSGYAEYNGTRYFIARIVGVNKAVDIRDFYSKSERISEVLGRKMRMTYPTDEGSGMEVLLFDWHSPIVSMFDAEYFKSDSAKPLGLLAAEKEERDARIALGVLNSVPDKIYFNERENTREGYLYMGERLIGPQGGFWWPIKKMTHVLVQGTSGGGKSAFFAQVMQGVLANERYFEKVFLVDLKGGVELWEYNGALNGKVRTIYKHEDLADVVDELAQAVDERLEFMRENNYKRYPGANILFVVDEFGQMMQPGLTKELKEYNLRIQMGLNKVSMLGRAAGVTLWAQLQKGTTDVMDSSFRANLQSLICFNVKSRLVASSMFGSTEDLLIDPLKLRPGQFIFQDGGTGETHYLQGRLIESQGRE